MTDFINYADLHQKSTQEQLFNQLFREGYVGISSVPHFLEHYKSYLKSAMDFMALPSEVRKESTPPNYYERGWSYGVEKLDGVPDTHKGSYYAQIPDDASNVWPKEDVIPNFRQNYLQLAQTIFNVSRQLIDLLYPPLKNNPIFPIGRMLYYGPVAKLEAGNSKSSNAWCTLHRDHSLITGLCPAAYFKEGQYFENAEIEDPEGGLFIRGKRVVVPQDILLFQVGEALQLLTNGKITSTLHEVKKVVGGFERYTFALFTDPQASLVMHSTDESFNDRFHSGMTYGEWSNASYKKYA